jgi:hypothetical protein
MLEFILVYSTLYSKYCDLHFWISYRSLIDEFKFKSDFTDK